MRMLFSKSRPKLAAAMVETFLSTAFEGGRHARRVALMDAIEG